MTNELKNIFKGEEYTWYVSNDRHKLRLMYIRGKLRNDIFEVCPLYNKKGSREYVINECEEIEEERKEPENT